MDKKQRKFWMFATLSVLTVVAVCCFIEWGAWDMLRIVKNIPGTSSALTDNKTENGEVSDITEIEYDIGFIEEKDILDNSIPETGEQLFEKYFLDKEEEKLETEDEIAKKYSPRFELLQKIYERKLIELMAKGAKEYETMKKSGEEFSKLALASRYLKKGRELENECDICFDRLLNQMEKDLKQASLALDLVKQTKDEYEKKKKQRRKEILNLIEKNI